MKIGDVANCFVLVNGRPAYEFRQDLDDNNNNNREVKTLICAKKGTEYELLVQRCKSSRYYGPTSVQFEIDGDVTCRDWNYNFSGYERKIDGRRVSWSTKQKLLFGSPRYVASSQIDNESAIDQVGSIRVDLFEAITILNKNEQQHNQHKQTTEAAHGTFPTAALPDSDRKQATIGVATVYGDAFADPVQNKYEFKRLPNKSLGMATLYYRDEYGLRMLLRKDDLPCSAGWEDYVGRIAGGDIPQGTAINRPLVSIPELSAPLANNTFHALRFAATATKGNVIINNTILADAGLGRLFRLMSNRQDVCLSDGGSYAPLFESLSLLLFSNKDLATTVYQIIRTELTRENLYEYYRCYYERLLEPGDKEGFEKLVANIAQSTSLEHFRLVTGHSHRRHHRHHHGLMILAFANALRVNLVVFSAAASTSSPNNNNNNSPGPVVFHFEGSPFPNTCFCLGHVHGDNYVIIREKQRINQVIVSLDDSDDDSSSNNNHNSPSQTTTTTTASQNYKSRRIKAERQEPSDKPTPTKRVKNEQHQQ